MPKLIIMIRKDRFVDFIKSGKEKTHFGHFGDLASYPPNEADVEVSIDVRVGI